MPTYKNGRLSVKTQQDKCIINILKLQHNYCISLHTYMNGRSVLRMGPTTTPLNTLNTAEVALLDKHFTHSHMQNTINITNYTTSCIYLHTRMGDALSECEITSSTN